MTAGRFSPKERGAPGVWGVWDSQLEDWTRIRFGGEQGYEMALGCAAQWNHMVAAHAAKIEAEGQALLAQPVPDVFPADWSKIDPL